MTGRPDVPTSGRPDEKINEKINENFAFFSIFGGVLRTAAKNRKKCLRKNRNGPDVAL